MGARSRVHFTIEYRTTGQSSVLHERLGDKVDAFNGVIGKYGGVRGKIKPGAIDRAWFDGRQPYGRVRIPITVEVAPDVLEALKKSLAEIGYSII